MNLALLSDQEWDRTLLFSPYKSFFQTSFWKNSVTTCFGGLSHLIKCQKKDQTWLIPLYLGTPWSKGFRIGSIGYGGPLPLQPVEDAEQEKNDILNIIKALENHYKLPCTGMCTYPSIHWSSLALHPNHVLTETEIISIKREEGYLFNHVLSGNVRTAIRKAFQEHIHIRVLQPEEIAEASLLLQETQKQVGASYTTPESFIQYLSQNHSQGVEIWGAFDASHSLIGMAVLLIYAGTAFHLFHGWKRNSIPPGTNQALIWEMVKSSLSHRCQLFNMGESHSLELKQAKQRWGTLSYPILRFQTL